MTDHIDLADELEEEFHLPAREAVREGADILLGDVVRRLRQRHGTRQTVAPAGQPPEEDTGLLSESFSRLPVRITGRVVSGGIQSSHPGANRLEFGATDVRGVRTFPHPYLRPAMEAVELPITRLLERWLA